MMDERHNIYKFSPFKVVKVIPVGNHQYGTNVPKPRSGHRIVADSGNIYSFGGYNPIADTSEGEEVDDFIWVDDSLLFKELWQFNIATKTWRKINVDGRLPEELASHAVILVHNNYMIVFGGSGVPFGNHSSNRVHVFNITTRSWETLNVAGDLPLEQYGQAIALYDNKLYAIGGTSGFEYSIDIHCLDLKTKIWSKCCIKPPFPEARYRHEVAVDGDRLFVFGGGTATECYTMHEVPVFNFEKQTWEIKKSWGTTCPDTRNVEAIPQARRCHGCVQLSHNVYISGGLNNNQVFSDIWKINLKSVEWQQLPVSLPRPLFFHATAVTPEGQMFVFGGVSNDSNQTRTNDMYSVWLTIPQLKEICWEAILHYIPHVRDKTVELFEIGVPRQFIERTL